MNRERLREKIQEKEMSQKELSRKLGLSVSAVGLWVNGFANPTEENLKKAAEILGCSVEYLKGEDEVKEENDLKRNGSGYFDPTAFRALNSIEDRSEKDVDFKRGEVWEYKLNNGEIKYAIIVSSEEFASDNHRNIIILSDEQRGTINVPVICRGKKYADCGMVSYGLLNRFENFVRLANEAEMKEIQSGIAKALGLEMPEECGSPLADRWQERYEKEKTKSWEVEQELAEAKKEKSELLMTLVDAKKDVSSLTNDLDIAHRENAKLAEKLKVLESQPVFPQDPDEVIRLKAQVEMLERQNEKLLDRLIG